MAIVERAKNILLTPKTEWLTIDGENDDHKKVFMSYLLILALIPTICSFVGYGLIGYKVLGVKVGTVGLGLKYAISQLLTIIIGAYATAYAFNFLAEKYGAVKNFDKAFQLAAYCYTAVCVGGFFYIIPGLRWIASLGSAYSLYLLYIGLAPMMKVPEEKKTSYFVVSFLAMAAVVILLSVVMGAILGIGSMLS